MSKTYLPYDPGQQLLLPAALQEWLPSEHLAYFISDVTWTSWTSRPLRPAMRRKGGAAGPTIPG